MTLVTEFRLLNVHAEIECPCRNPLATVEYEHTGSYSNEICRSAKRLLKFECSFRNELPHAAFSWEGADSQWEKVYVDMRRPLSEWYPSWRHQCNLPIWAEQMPIRNGKRCTNTTNSTYVRNSTCDIRKLIVALNCTRGSDFRKSLFLVEIVGIWRHCDVTHGWPIMTWDLFFFCYTRYGSFCAVICFSCGDSLGNRIGGPFRPPTLDTVRTSSHKSLTLVFTVADRGVWFHYDGYRSEHGYSRVRVLRVQCGRHWDAPECLHRSRSGHLRLR